MSSEPGDTFQESEDALDTRPDTRLAKSRQPGINIYQDLVQFQHCENTPSQWLGMSLLPYQPMIVNRVNVMHDIRQKEWSCTVIWITRPSYEALSDPVCCT